MPKAVSVTLAGVLLLLAGPVPAAFALTELRQVREFETARGDILQPGAVAYRPSSQTFCVLPAAGAPQDSTSMSRFSFMGDPTGATDVGTPAAGLEATYDTVARNLVLFDDRLDEVTTTDGSTWPGTGVTQIAPLPQLGTVDAAGITVDPATRILYVLDRASRRIAAVPAAAWVPPGNPAEPVSWITLAGLSTADLRGLAFHTSTQHFDVLDAGAELIREVDLGGATVRSLGIGEAGLTHPQGLVRAPSGDLTDTVGTTHLYVTDAGMSAEPTSAAVVELAAPQAVSTAVATTPSTLVQTIDTSRWSPPSPDPSGIAYEPGRNRLLVSDGEVDEMSIYSGANYYESSLTGQLLRSTNTLRFTHEPTGVAFDPGRNFFTDDDAHKAFQVGLGTDSVFGTTDTVTASFSTSAFGSGDPEGVAYDPAGDRLFIADGVNAEIYEVDARDGVFGNADDTLSHFDTSSLGASDPETVEFNPDTGTLYTMGSGGHMILEVTPSGSLVSEMDVSFLPTIHAAGIAYAPSSNDPTKKSLYIADRRQDNGDNPNENDGRIYEVTAGSSGGPPPVGDYRVGAGTDDAEESASGTVNTTSGDLELVTDTSVQTVGVRFPAVTVPRGATITNAYIQFSADESQSEPTTLSLAAQAADNAATFTTTARNISTRPRTTATASWSPPPWTASDAGPAQRTPDLTPVVQQVVSRSGWASGNAMAFIVTGSGHRTAVAFNTSAARAPVLHVDFTEGPPPTNQAPSVNAGPDQTITLPATAALDGTVSDDGRPNATPSTTWTEVSGPGTVTFANAAAVDTTASFSTDGTYVLRLAANDGALTTTDDVTVTVQPAPPVNQPPAVNAGPDQTITLPATAALDGTVSDDGRPNATPSTTWTEVSGPGTVTFANAAAVDTTASFSTDGTYVLRLAANDGALTTTDDVTITVRPAATSTTTAEVRVAAGADDAEEKPSGSVDPTSTDLELVIDGSPQTVGIRFAGLAVPRGATITSAYVQFVADETQSEATSLSIQGEAADSAAPYARVTRNISTRPRTSAATSWAPSPWTAGQLTAAQRTPDLSGVVQQIVNRPGWASGNALALIITGTGHRTAKSFEGGAASAPLLHVEFR